MLWFDLLIALLLFSLQVLQFNTWIQTNLSLIQKVEHRVCHQKWTQEAQR
ncbi:MAG: hypothetical protein ACKOAD_08540 [Gammaproteobacteria bacterium]